MHPSTRREALRDRLPELGLGALLVTDPTNIRYLTGFTGSAGQLLVTADGGDDLLVTDGRYAEQSAAQAPDVPRHVTRGDDWFPGALAGRTAVGLEAATVSWGRARALAAVAGSTRLVPTDGLVEDLRAIKDDDELAAIAAACAIGDEAFADLLDWLAAGMTERQVGIRLDRTMVDLGAADRSFATIVASGPNSAVPHHRPTDRVLAAGDLVKLDFGALVGGYHSDMTRMVALGDPGPELRAIHDVVLTAQAAGLRAVADGVTGHEVDAACRAVIIEAGHGDRFVHGTGHGLGLQIHEDPRLAPVTGPLAAASAAGRLASRMTVTVEPGVYVAGRGGVRIEDTVIVGPRDAGPVTVLTHTPKDLVVL
jgi:Xaa-Pro aminopeptidase